jgi:hypothetical protein
MKREIFVVRGNITPMIARLEQLTKEREEREKAEREERWKREREERERKAQEWKNLHPILDKFTYISAYNYDTYSWPGDYVNIRFYEWSNLDIEPKFFSHSIAFYRFLDECKINLTDEQNNKIKSNSGCHITCIPGTHDLVIGTSYDSLKSNFNLAKILKSVNEPESKPSSVSNLPAVRYNQEEEYP